jgi:hypothetical protein
LIISVDAFLPCFELGVVMLAVVIVRQLSATIAKATQCIIRHSDHPHLIKLCPFAPAGLEIVLTLGAAYGCYFVAEELAGASGLLAVVVMGFSMSLLGE